MVDYDYDVVVVGGGPGGVIAAISVARAGYSCLILDKKPRDRIGDKNCGDALDGNHTNTLYQKMGIKPPSLEDGEVRDPIERITLAARNLDTKFSAPVPGYQVDRLVYGQRLLEMAESEGAEINANCPVRGIIVENDHVVGVKYFDEERKQQEVYSKITIDASGYVGTVRKELPKSLTQGLDLSFSKKWSIGTYREIIRLNQKEDHDFRKEIVLLYHNKIRPPGYAWIFTEGEKMLNIGITWIKSDPYPDGKSMKDIYHEILDQYFDPNNYEIVHAGGGNIPMRPNFDSLAFNGVMIVGDAGGLADPTTFEGHGPALESGRLAGSVAVNALEKNSFSEEDLWEYNKLVMDYPGALHSQSFLAARLIEEIGVNDLAVLFGKKIITQEELDNLFKKGASLSTWSIFKMIMKAFPRWDILFKVRKYVKKIEKVGKIYKEYPEHPDGLKSWRDKRNQIIGYQF